MEQTQAESEVFVSSVIKQTFVWNSRRSPKFKQDGRLCKYPSISQSSNSQTMSSVT